MEFKRIFKVIDKMTGKEADPEEIALNEAWADGLIYCDMEGFAVGEDGRLYLLDECGRFEYAPDDRFEVVWDATDNNVGNKWIPVTERLPSKSESVLALSSEYMEYQIGWLAECEEEHFGIVCVGDGIELYKVTHWMPLPEPPKGE